MDSFKSNRTWSIFLLSNGTENVTKDIEQLEVKKTVAFARAFLIFVAVFGIFGNAITIPALSRSKKIRSVTIVFIVNLCIADLIYCFLTLLNYLCPQWSQNSLYCRWFPFIRYLVGGESIYTVVAITINRYVCIAHRSIYRTMYKPRYLYLMIFMTWLYSLLLTMTPFFGIWGQYGFVERLKLCDVLRKDGRTPINYFWFSALLYPIIAFLICYPRIFWIVRKTSKELYKYKENSPPSVELTAAKMSTREKTVHSKFESVGAPLASDKQYQKEIRVLKVMLAVVIGFIVCYFPLAFMKILDTKRNLRILRPIAEVGINLSNVINPIIYVVMSSEYRKAYKEFFLSIKEFASTSSNSELINA